MKWSDWKKTYYKIMEKLDFDIEADVQSEQLLETYLAKLSPDRKEIILSKLKIIQQKPVIIAGAGPSLKKDFSRLFVNPYSKKILTELNVDFL